MREEAVTFGSLKSLVGVVTSPIGENNKHDKTAVILLNPGIVHRVGAGRIHVKLARTLAPMGFLTMRFDFSGIGDSAVRRDNLQFEKSAVTEAREAMDFLAGTRGVDHFILLGGCSGAKIALDTACCDARVIGVLLINFPSAKDEDPAANPEVIHRGASFYYRKYALFNFRSWRRLITGKANYGKLCRALWFEIKRRLAVRENISIQAQQFQASLRRLANRGVQATFLCSEGDPRLEDLRAAGGNELRRLCAEHKIALEIIQRSDHTFSSLQDQNQLLSVLLKRADAIVPCKKDPSNKYDAITDTSNAFLHQLQS